MNTQPTVALRGNALTKLIGKRIRAARKRLRLTVRELALRDPSGRLTYDRVSRYERGDQRPDLTSARLLAECLGTVTAAHLLTLDEEETLLEDEFRLLRLYRSHGETAQKKILDIACALERLGGTLAQHDKDQ